MKKKLLSKTLSVFTAMFLVFASAAVPAYAQDGDYSLGAAHREFVESSRSGTSSGHTVSSQFRESQAGAPSGFMDRLRQGWEDLSSSFRFRPRDTDSGTSGGGNIVDDMSPSIVGTGIGQGQDALANSMTSLGRRQPSQYQAAGNRLQQAGESLRSNGYITRTVDTINTVDTIRTFTDTGHTHPSMVWTHYSFKAGGLLTSNIGAASAAAPCRGSSGGLCGRQCLYQLYEQPHQRCVGNGGQHDRIRRQYHLQDDDQHLYAQRYCRPRPRRQPRRSDTTTPQQRDTGRADERYMEFYKNHVQLSRARS